MIDRTIWAGLSVTTFFDGYNWQGLPTQLQPLPTSENSNWQSSSWINLSVAEFFGSSNWQGRSFVKPEPLQPTLLSPSLTLSVQNYFGQFSWRGRSTPIESVAQESFRAASTDISRSGTSSSPMSSSEFKLTDLSDLF